MDLGKDASDLSFLQRANVRVQRNLYNFFYHLGKWISNHTLVTIMSTTVFAAILMSGISQLTIEKDFDELYTPQDSQAFKDREFVEENFGNDPRVLSLYVGPKNFETTSPDNILTKEALLEFMDVYDVMMETEAFYEDEEMKIQDRCMHIIGTDICGMQSILGFWNYNRTIISELSQDQIVTTINIATVTSRAGTLLVIDPEDGGILIGSAKHDGKQYALKRDDDGQIVGASVFQLMLFLKNEPFGLEGSDQDHRSIAFENAVYARVESLELEILSAHFYSEGVWYIEQDKSIWADVSLLTIGYTLMITYANLVLWRRNPIKSRSMLGFPAVASVGLAVGGSMGLCSYAGIKYSLVLQALAFLLLGIGIDDTFVIMDCLKQIDIESEGKLDRHERIGRTLGTAGASITATSLTDFVAFLLSLSSGLPALQAFAIYASVGVLLDFFFQCTFFVAFVSLDLKRQEQSRYDMAICIQKPEHQNIVLCGSGPDEVFDESKPTFVQKTVSVTLTQFTLHPVGKVVIIVAALALLGAGAYGATQTFMEFRHHWFIPKDHNLWTSIDMGKQYFDGQNLPVIICSKTGDYVENQAELIEMRKQVNTNKWTKDNSFSSWYDGLMEWIQVIDPQGETYLNDKGEIKDRDTFYMLLGQFLSSPAGQRYGDDLVFGEDGKIEAAQYSVFLMALDNASDEIEAMQSVRKSLQDSAPSFETLAYAWFFVFWEGNAVIVKEVIRNVILAACCVLIILLFVLGNAAISIIIFLIIVAIDIELLGWLAAAGLEFNSVTTLNIVLAIGLSVDYSVHIGHSFMVSQGTRNERARVALEHLGAAVANGGISTFLAVVMMAGAQSYIFRVFFSMFTAFIILGLFHGLLVLPVILSLIGPAPLPEECIKAPYSSEIEMESNKESDVGETDKDSDISGGTESKALET